MLFFMLFTSIGCKKEDEFLAAKPNQALAIPKTLNELQLLLDNQSLFNKSYPAMGQMSTDDIELPNASFIALDQFNRNTYTWMKEIYPAGYNVIDWNDSYSKIYYANTVLDALTSIPSISNQEANRNAIKGSALFFRANAFYHLLQIFSLPYNATTATSNLGIPLKLSSDLNIKVQRSTQQESYDQVKKDLNEALSLLPDIAAYKTRPSKMVVYFLLARIEMLMGNFSESLRNANNALQIYSTLQDFNLLDPSVILPTYPNFSSEDVLHLVFSTTSAIGFNTNISAEIINSFNDPNDLRRAVYLYNNRGNIIPISLFDRTNSLYCGYSTNELYLIKAECEARAGNISAAMSSINALLMTRWRRGTFRPLTAVSGDEALRLIINERRRELMFTGARWFDLRRLSQDSRFAKTLSRTINGVTYTLPPNDPRYALPIPDNEIQLSGLQQNNR